MRLFLSLFFSLTGWSRTNENRLTPTLIGMVSSQRIQEETSPLLGVSRGRARHHRRDDGDEKGRKEGGEEEEGERGSRARLYCTVQVVGLLRTSTRVPVV